MLLWNGAKFISAARRYRRIGFRRRFKSERVMDQPNFAGDYDVLLDLVKSRASVRKPYRKSDILDWPRLFPQRFLKPGTPETGPK